jgi:hypothetical protein
VQAAHAEADALAMTRALQQHGVLLFSTVGGRRPSPGWFSARPR